MELICTGDGDVPLWMKMCSGNSSDQKQFVGAMIEFKKQLQLESLMVADSAFYTQENLQISKDIKGCIPILNKAKNLMLMVRGKRFSRSEVRGQRSEVRGQRLEVFEVRGFRGQRSEVRGFRGKR